MPGIEAPRLGHRHVRQQPQDEALARLGRSLAVAPQGAAVAGQGLAVLRTPHRASAARVR
jgi:hypothetical protein